LRQQWASPELDKIVTFFAYHEPPGLRGFGQSLQEIDSPAWPQKEGSASKGEQKLERLRERKRLQSVDIL
jgi:hypothetical protein